MMSGRLTPAAATLMRTSPGAGAGVGRSAGVSASGPPGLLISITRMSSHCEPSDSRLHDPEPWRQRKHGILVANRDHEAMVLGLGKFAPDISRTQLAKLELVQLVDESARELRRGP